MTGALKVFLLLLQGSLCLRWEITIPLRIEGLTGSCVKVPCTFSLDSQVSIPPKETTIIIEPKCPLLEGSSVSLLCKSRANPPVTNYTWYKGDAEEKDAGSILILNNVKPSNSGDYYCVAKNEHRDQHSSLIRLDIQSSLEIRQAETFCKETSDGTCRTMSAPPSSTTLSHSDNYHFRIQCDNRLKTVFPTGVRITTQNALNQATITPSTLEVEEGALVTLNCTAVAPCPILPPDLTWTPRIGDIEEKHESESMVSVMNFTSSYLHNGQHFPCTALYKRQAGNTDLRFEKFMTLHVLYPPTNTSVSYSATVKEGRLVNLTCNANANPAMYTWYKVNGGQVTDVGSEKRFSTTVSEVDRQLYCKVSNRYGTQNSSITHPWRFRG